MKIPTSVKISEDDESRSRYMWHLIQDSCDSTPQYANSKIPRVLIQFWDDSNTIPPDVQQCINTWQPLDKIGFRRLLFDDNKARTFISHHYDLCYSHAFERCRHPAMRADYFRLCYIFKKGGFYVDADDVCINSDVDAFFNNNKLKVQPLCYDVKTDLMVNTEDFIKSGKYQSTCIYYVNNDPLIAPPNHPLVKLALERSTRFLLASGRSVDNIQSATGPGNFTASLVRYAIESRNAGKEDDFILIDNWNIISQPQWPLEYRKDKRNWRIWDGTDM